MPDPPAVVDFEDENVQNGAKALEYSRTLVMPFNKTDIAFWFTQIENEMFTCEIKSQWMKRVVLVKNLPPEVQNDVKSLLVLKQSEAPPDIYKQVKKELLRIHAPKEEDKYKKALGRVLTGLPSQLGQQLINDICDKSQKLSCGCCAKAVFTLWGLQLPLNVRAQVANMPFNANTYHEVFQAADKVYLSTKVTDVSAGVAAINDLSGSAGGVAEVAAVKKPSKGKPPGKGNKGNKGKPSAPPNCCANHKKWQADAWFCLEPLTCPMVSKVSAKPTTPATKPAKENK